MTNDNNITDLSEDPFFKFGFTPLNNNFLVALGDSQEKLGSLMVQGDAPRSWLVATDWQYEIYDLVKKFDPFNTTRQWTSEYIFDGKPYRICVEPNFENIWLVNMDTRKRQLMIMIKYHSGSDCWPETP